MSANHKTAKLDLRGITMRKVRGWEVLNGVSNRNGSITRAYNRIYRMKVKGLINWSKNIFPQMMRCNYCSVARVRDLRSLIKNEPFCCLALSLAKLKTLHPVNLVPLVLLKYFSRIIWKFLHSEQVGPNVPSGQWQEGVLRPISGTQISWSSQFQSCSMHGSGSIIVHHHSW